MRTPTGFRWSSPSPPALCSSVWRAAVAVVVLVPLLAWAPPAGADPIASQRAEAARLAQQLQDLGLRVSRLSEQYDAARLRVDELNARLAQARANLGTTDAQLASARGRVRDIAVSAYIRGGSAAELQMFVPKTTEELTVRNTYMSTIAAGASDAIDSLHAAHAQIGEQQAQLLADQAAAVKALAAAAAAQHAAALADAAERAALARVQGQLASMVAAAQAEARAALAARVQADITAREARAAASRNRSSSGGAFGGSGSLPPPPPGAAGAVEEARRQLGKPYEYGGSGPDAFDCSGLTAWAWGHAGRSLPHSAAAQYDVTTHIPVSALQPGDLVFYGSPPHHVGIYVGGGEMINALHSGTNVEYDSIYVEGDLIGGGRVN